MFHQTTSPNQQSTNSLMLHDGHNHLFIHILIQTTLNPSIRLDGHSQQQFQGISYPQKNMSFHLQAKCSSNLWKLFFHFKSNSIQSSIFKTSQFTQVSSGKTHSWN
jgi:hypothetical protein